MRSGTVWVVSPLCSLTHYWMVPPGPVRLQVFVPEAWTAVMVYWEVVAAVMARVTLLEGV